MASTLGSGKLLPAMALLALLFTPTTALAGDEADPAEFFRRLESIGLSTDYLRKLTGKIELFFRDSTDDVEAEWGFITDNLYIPPTHREEGSKRIKYGLEPHHISTLIHEYTHADLDILARESSPSGTPERVHWNSTNTIWADLYNDSKHRLLGLARFPRMKADEVTGYFMGKVISELFWAAKEILLYNKVMGGSRVASEAEARRLGGTFVLPPANTTNGWEKRVLGYTFGDSSVYHDAMFKSSQITGPKLIHWNEKGRGWLKKDMYQGILGLNPPADLAELLRRLNTLDNAWLRGVRAEVAAARLEWARKQAAAAASQAANGRAPLGQ